MTLEQYAQRPVFREKTHAPGYARELVRICAKGHRNRNRDSGCFWKNPAERKYFPARVHPYGREHFPGKSLCHPIGYRRCRIANYGNSNFQSDGSVRYFIGNPNIGFQSRLFQNGSGNHVSRSERHLVYFFWENGHCGRTIYL